MKDYLKKLGVQALVVVGGMWVGWWVFGALGLATMVGECRGHKKAQEVVTAPVVAPPTKAEEKAEERPLPCVDVKAIEPGKKERKRIAEEYHRDDLRELGRELEARATPRVAEILGERELPVMPDGGRALVTLEPDGRVEVTTVANPEPFFEWRSAYEVGGLYGVGSGGDARWRAWAAVEPLRLGRVHLRVEAGAEQRAGQVDAYGMAGAVWRVGEGR